MNPARRATPDSEAVASSEDEKPWPSSMSFGKFPLKEGGMPGLPGGIWSTRSGSFKLSDKAKLDARASVRLGAVNQVRGTPSPSVSEGAGALPFAIPLQPTPKTGRSMSHSQGQREPSQNVSSTQQGNHAALPLGLLAEEEADTESESELGTRLTHTTSHPPIGSLMRTATLPPTFDHPRGSSNDSDYQDSHSPQPGLLRGQTFGAAFANLSLDHNGRRAQWQSSLGWDDVPNVNESRRHSLADIPTRRGSLAAGEPSLLSRTFTHDPQESDEFHQQHSDYQGYALGAENSSNMTRAPDGQRAFDIPAMYRVPHVSLTQTERRDIEMRREQQPNSAPQWGPSAGRPRKQLYIVSFKCSRVDVFYLLDNTGLTVREGDLVIVEADRGQDLGTVQHAKVTPDVARLLKKKYSEEQYKWLMMYSRNKDGGYNPNAQIQNDSSGGGMMGSAFANELPSSMQGALPRDNFNNLKPKAIKRLASDHEIKMLAEKEGNEAKAKRTCQQKVQHLRLQMEILDAEWQWDFQKLIFYYYADHYINFKDLITELYRIYKTRIWLSAINPASFSQHAMGQPPSGIGPGAVAPYNPYATNQGYTMAYGEDRDPYGAQMPYRIPYETYTPNYPAIPGVTNSFAPQPYGEQPNYAFYAQPPQQSPTGPGLQQTFSPSTGEMYAAPGQLMNRGGQQNNFFYDGNRNMEQLLGSGNGLGAAPDNHGMQAIGSREGFAQAPDQSFSRPFPGMLGAAPQSPNDYASPQSKAPQRKLTQPPIGTRPVFGSADPFSFPPPQQRAGPGQEQPRLVFGQQPAQNDSAGPDNRLEGLADLGSGGKEQDKKADKMTEKMNKADMMLRFLNDTDAPEDP
ncbi:hypothetical protein CKM354_000621200 [Cercospora kikuchii]|uniref:PSP1 C-terminal domain-containing protein n=1 Tax=Cercospora kikuchii TaxID=84275 RepID=A0A9P3CM17_9PEZI|nr:uncharacterized protein CKM354_000621200 [Cercospora kikuchii]GIZ42965.1 hypothetical protein CKM354_000621200 [Cercospora kikuchii]